MSYSDNIYVNFSEDHELNYILRRFNKQQTHGNRNLLTGIAADFKRETGQVIIKHSEFYPYIEKFLDVLS